MEATIIWRTPDTEASSIVKWTLDAARNGLVHIAYDEEDTSYLILTSDIVKLKIDSVEHILDYYQGGTDNDTVVQGDTTIKLILR
jgi:hypothetical protein